jgi:hypothetical protein
MTEHYRKGELDLDFSGKELRRGKVLGDFIAAGSVGLHMARLQNFQGLAHADIDSALGPPWSERGKDYPKTLGLALFRAGLDPDVPELRDAAVNAIFEFYNPLPYLVVTSSAKKH